MQAPVQLQQLSQTKAALEAAAQHRSLAANAAGTQQAPASAESQVSGAWEDGGNASAVSQGGAYGWGLDALDFGSGGSWGSNPTGLGAEQGPRPSLAGEVSVSVVDWVHPQSVRQGEARGLGSGLDSGPGAAPGAGGAGEAWSPVATPRTAAAASASRAWDTKQGSAACHDSDAGASERPPEAAQGRLTGAAQAAVAAGLWPAAPSAPPHPAGAGLAEPAARVAAPAGAASRSSAAASDPFAGLLSASGLRAAHPS